MTAAQQWFEHGGLRRRARASDARRACRRGAASSALALLALCAGAVQAEEPPCVFNAHAFSAATYRHRPGVAFVQWSEPRSTAAIVTRTGLAVSVRHWSCMHLGAEARAVIDGDAKGEDIAAALAELADVVLQPGVARRVRPLIAAHEFDPAHPDRLDLPPGGEEEFYVASEPLGSVVVLTLRHYRD